MYCRVFVDAATMLALNPNTMYSLDTGILNIIITNMFPFRAIARATTITECMLAYAVHKQKVPI